MIKNVKKSPDSKSKLYKKKYFHNYYMKHRKHYLNMVKRRRNEIRSGYKEFMHLKKQGKVEQGDNNND